MYYSASDEDELSSWFNEVVKGAEQQVNGPSESILYYFGEKKLPQGIVELGSWLIVTCACTLL